MFTLLRNLDFLKQFFNTLRRTFKREVLLSIKDKIIVVFLFLLSLFFVWGFVLEITPGNLANTAEVFVFQTKDFGIVDFNETSKYSTRFIGYFFVLILIFYSTRKNLRYDKLRINYQKFLLWLSVAGFVMELVAVLSSYFLGIRTAIMRADWAFLILLLLYVAEILFVEPLKVNNINVGRERITN